MCLSREILRCVVLAFSLYYFDLNVITKGTSFKITSVLICKLSKEVVLKCQGWGISGLTVLVKVLMSLVTVTTRSPDPSSSLYMSPAP